MVLSDYSSATYCKYSCNKQMRCVAIQSIQTIISKRKCEIVFFSQMRTANLESYTALI